MKTCENYVKDVMNYKLRKYEKRRAPETARIAGETVNENEINRFIPFY